MRILIDTNIVLDILLNRTPFVQDAVDLLKLCGEHIQESISATPITDIYYISYKALRDKHKVKDIIKRLLSVIHIAGVSEETIFAALDSDWNDFEDAVQNAVAESHNFDAIITRNPRDFKNSALRVILPKDFLRQTKNYQIL